MRAIRKSELKQTIRDEARAQVRPPSVNLGANKTYQTQVEAGRERLNRVAAEGGDSKGKKAKQELLYLLNNYLPSYDNRIEQLIDIWRRSGDKDYDPGVRVKLRQARLNYSKKTNPI